MEKVKKEVKGSFIFVILLVAFALVLYVNPDNFINIAINVFGYVSIFWGVILSFYYLKKPIENNQLTKGVLFILYGIIAILKSTILANIFTILLGGYLIYQSANRLYGAYLLLKNKKDIWLFILILTITNIILSFLLFFDPLFNFKINTYMATIIIICEFIIVIQNIVFLTIKEEHLEKK